MILVANVDALDDNLDVVEDPKLGLGRVTEVGSLEAWFVVGKWVRIGKVRKSVRTQEIGPWACRTA